MDGGGCFMPKVKASKSQPRKPRTSQRAPNSFFTFKRVRNFVYTLTIVLSLIFLYFNGESLVNDLSDKTVQNLAHAGFKLEDVIVEGRIRTDKDKILKNLDLERNKPLFSINLGEAKNKLESFTWIKAARIERKLPHTIIIRLSEKEPIALWTHQSKTYLVDKGGSLVELQDTQKYKELLRISGRHAPKHVGDLLTLLEEFPDLKTRITGAIHLRASRWDLRLDDKVDVKLPETNTSKALAYLLDLEQNHRLTEREIVTIDMRLPGQLILRLTPESVKKKSSQGKDA